MTVKMEKYHQNHGPAIEKLMIKDDFVRRDMEECLSGFPECAIVARSGESIAAVGVYTGVSERTSFTFYVHPAYRS